MGIGGMTPNGNWGTQGLGQETVAHQEGKGDNHGLAGFTDP
jgi:hypothetical protein